MASLSIRVCAKTVKQCDHTLAREMAQEPSKKNGTRAKKPHKCAHPWTRCKLVRTYYYYIVQYVDMSIALYNLKLLPSLILKYNN
jgi:hypothetical protein